MTDPDSSLPYLPASIKQRVAAALIDGLSYFLFMYVAGEPAGFILATAYMLTRDALPFLDGQSVGKKVMHLQAVTYDLEDSLSGKWGISFLRNLPLAIPLLSIAELIILWKDENSLRFGDRWAKTKVMCVRS